MSKTVNTRIQNKIDTSANWAKATNFTPLKGEIIIYSDLKKIKIGDGVTKVGALQFLADDNTHQSIKTLKTDNTTAQSPSSGETIAGSGTINLHKVSKTGSYNDLLNKPTIPSAYQLPIANASALGGVKSSTTGTTANRDYNVQVKADGTMKVNVPWTDTNTDTHYTAHMYAGAKDTQSNSATTNGNTYLKLVENGAMRDQHNIVGAGRTTVTSDANGKITISSTSPSSYTDTQIDNKDQAILTSAKGYVDGKPGINATGTVTGIKMNGTTKTPTNGTVDLGTVITAHQDISGKQDKIFTSTANPFVLTEDGTGIDLFKLQFTTDGILRNGDIVTQIPSDTYIQGELDKKQDKLNTNQLSAVNSGITSTKVTKYDGYDNKINNKQDKLTTTQLSAVNSGINSTKVQLYDSYETSIDDIADTKQDTLVSGTNIKTINNTSILGSGNINFTVPGEVAKITGSSTNYCNFERYGSSAYRCQIRHDMVSINQNEVINYKILFPKSAPLSGVPTVVISAGINNTTDTRQVYIELTEVTDEYFCCSVASGNTAYKITFIEYIAVFTA